MKKILLSSFLAVIMLCAMVLPAYASEAVPESVQNSDGFTVIYYDDGSCITISPVYVSESEVSARASTQTKTGSRDVTFTDTNGNVEWKYTLSATFSYVYGSSVSCTSSTYKNNIYDSSWTFSNGSATRSGNTAYGKGHYTKKVLFVTTKNYDVDISVSCDKYGNIS